MKKIIIILVCLSLHYAKAQQIFIPKGKIEFEKQLNLHKEVDEWDNGEDNIWKQNMKKNLPKIQTTYFNLLFDQDKTLYKAGKDAPSTGFQKIPEWFKDDALENITYNDLTTQQTTSQKNIFENIFLLQDSLPKINWRITSDTRMIAGFECRKAIGKIMDSVYVIAFYTDIILNSGGPESFTGLPGMILGVAIPRINTTWFATKVELVEVKETEMIAPKKGKKAKYPELMQQLKTSTKDWGKNSERHVWRALI